MGAKHVLRPKSHQRSVSYALNTSKLGDETVAFKFYGRCKKGLLTSPGWSAPWSARGWWWLAWQTWWCAEGPRHRGQGHNRPTKRCPECLRVAGRIWSPRIRWGLLGADWTQADVHFKGLRFQKTSAGYVSGLRQSHLETDTFAERSGGAKRLMTIPQSDHNAAPSPDRPETDPIASSKDPKGPCQSSFTGVHSSQHLMWFTAPCFARHFSLKSETSKVSALLRVVLQN